MTATTSERNIQRFELKEGDILLTKDSEDWQDIGVPAFISEDLPGVVCGYHLFLSRPDEDVVFPQFLFWALKSRYVAYQFEGAATGVTRYGLTTRDVANAWIPCPGWQEQQAIADFLDTTIARIDTLVEKNQRLLKLLEEKQSALVEKSVIEGTNEREFEANDRLEVLEEYPTGWDVRRAKTLFIPRDDRGHDDLPLLEVSLNHGVRLREENEERTAWVASDLGDMKRVAPGDIVYNKMRLWQGAVDHSEYEGLVSPDYTVLEPRPEANPEYYAHLLRTEAYKTEVNRRSYGLVDDRNRIYWKQFGDMPLLHPPREEQDEIVEQIRRSIQQIEELRDKVQEAIDHLKEKRQALITAAVTGQIDVTDGPEGK